MIVEFFGLSKTGKSILADKLKKQNYKVIDENEINLLKKIFFLFAYIFKNPLSTVYLFNKLNTNHIDIPLPLKIKLRILIMRNSYLAGVLSKYQRIKNNKQLQFVQEFFLQALFIILQSKSNEKELRQILSKFTKSEYLFLFERDKKRRHEIYHKPHLTHNKSLMFPGAEISKKYAIAWMEVMEYNYNIIKRLILEIYQEDKTAFEKVNSSLPMVLKLKHP